MSWETIALIALISASGVIATCMVFLAIACVRLIARIDDPNEMGYEPRKRGPKVSTRLREVIENRRSELHLPKDFVKQDYQAPDDESAG